MKHQEKFEDIVKNPEKHRHTYEELIVCSMIDKVLKLSLLVAHQKYAPVGMNGGIRCDVTEGPCACGVWH